MTRLFRMSPLKPKSVMAKARRITSLAVLAAMLLLLSGGYVFSLYEELRSHLKAEDMPLLKEAVATNRELVAIQGDLMLLIAQAREGRLREEEVYRQGRLLFDRLDAIEAGMHNNDGLVTKNDRSHERATLREKLALYRTNLVGSVEMLSVDVGLAESYSVRAAREALVINGTIASQVELVYGDIEREMAELGGSLRRMAIPLVAIFCIATALALIRLHRLGRDIANTFSGTHRALIRLHQGETEVAVPLAVDTPEAADIQAALETFRHTLAELQSVRRDLERQVGERTRSLQQANIDLEDRYRRLAEAERSLRLYKKVFDNTGEAVIVTQLDGTIVEINDAYERVTGYTREELLGNNPRVTKSGLHDAAFYQAMWAEIKGKGNWSGEIWDRRRNGESYPIWLSISAVLDESGAPINYVGVFMDISSIKATEQQLEQLAYYDRLTGLPNRRLLMDRLTHAIAMSARSRKLGAIFFIDIDRFKRINDSLGHRYGDLLLGEVAARLKRCAREADTVGRLAGDEFVVLLEELAEDRESAANYARRVADKMLAALAEPYQLEQQEQHCSGSIGIALFDGGGVTPDAMLSEADTAMYEAKKAGRGGYCFFDPSMQDGLQKRVDLENRLRAAPRQGQLSLHYQVQVDAAGRALGVEALLRWCEPQLGMVPPAEFIPLAEELHLIQEIGRWVMVEACRQLAAWDRDDATRGLSMAINVSGLQFAQKGFADDVREIVAEVGIDPSRIKLELTESVVLQSIEKSITTMHQLQALGVQLAMDDFGTGYSSLSYIKRLPFDQIKIDRMFVTHMLENENDRFIVSAVLGMARLLGMDVVAEGVESSAQCDALRAMGCHAYQGYFFGKPVPSAELPAVLASLSDTVV